MKTILSAPPEAITPHQQAADESRFRSLFEQVSNIAVQGYDAERRVIYWNAASEALYGYRRDEAIGRQLEDLIIPDAMRQGVIDATAAWLRGGPAIPAAELTLRRKDNSPVAVFSSHVMLANAHGEAEMYCVDIELTELKKTEAELRAYQTQLEAMVDSRTADLAAARDSAEAASRAKSTFLANMSHELRTPMNAIMGMTEIVRRKLRDPEQIARLVKVKQASEHLLNVINDILDLSKIEAGRLILERVEFTLGDVFDNLVTIAGQKAQEKGLELRLCVADELMAEVVCGDPLRLGQVLLNLVGNSVKFTESGYVKVSATRTECNGRCTALHVEVSDTGIGIPEHYRSRLFSSFEQASESMTRKYGGTGLGLAISKRLVELMGGRIGVSSTPGDGSTFWFDICLAAVTEVPAIPGRPNMQSTERVLRNRHEGKLVLLVEDDATNQEVARMLIEEAGLRVAVADDGAQAVVMARTEPYALILMDMQMPVMSGLEATRAIRAQGWNTRTPIVAMTANAFAEDRAACIDAGMNEHVGKPVDTERLYAVMLDQLDNSGDLAADEASEVAKGSATSGYAPTNRRRTDLSS